MGRGRLPRTGIDHGYATVGVRPRPDWPGLLELNPYVETHLYTNLQGILETRLATAGLDLDFRDGSTAMFGVTDRYEHVFESFFVRGTEVVPGRYDFREGQAFPAALLLLVYPARFAIRAPALPRYLPEGLTHATIQRRFRLDSVRPRDRRILGRFGTSNYHLT